MTWAKEHIGGPTAPRGTLTKSYCARILVKNGIALLNHFSPGKKLVRLCQIYIHIGSMYDIYFNNCSQFRKKGNDVRSVNMT